MRFNTLGYTMPTRMCTKQTKKAFFIFNNTQLKYSVTYIVPQKTHLPDGTDSD